MKKVIIAGATGLVGSECLKLLLQSPEISEVETLVRRPLFENHSKLKETIVDFTKLKSFGPADALVCCLGTTIKNAGSRPEFEKVDYDFVISLARVAIENSIPHFLVVSAVGANSRSNIFYSRTKGRMEETLRLLSFQSLTIFRPSFLLGDRRETRMGEIFGKILIQMVSPVLTGPFDIYHPIEARDVAKSILKSILTPKLGAQILHYKEMISNS